MNAIVLHVELTVLAEHRQAYLDRVLKHRRNVRDKEPACRQFDISVDGENPNLVRLYEVYDDGAAVDHHMQTPYMIAYREETAPMIAHRKLSRAVRAHD